MKIVSLHPLLVPSSIGGFQVHLYGLGDDSRVYLWTAKDGEWEPVKVTEPEKKFDKKKP